VIDPPFRPDRDTPDDARLIGSPDNNGEIAAVLHPSPTPTEPLEQLEPTAQPSTSGRLCGDRDSSVGHRDETRARVGALGIEVARLFESFSCVIPGHDDRARVNFTKVTGTGSSQTGFWRYYCDGLAHGAGLAEARAFIAYGGERPLSPTECARWHERLDFEAGLLMPIPLPVELPEPCPGAARTVAGWMRVFVGLRNARFPLDEPFVFAREFASAYCGLSTDMVRAAMSWLERAGVISRAGTHGLAILWRLAAQDEFGGRLDHERTRRGT
jgi:hypothetical protein